MKYVKTYESFLNEGLNDSDARKAVSVILKTLHSFSDKIKFRTEYVNGIYNIVYDDPKGLTDDCLKDLRNSKFWNTGFAPVVGKFDGNRVNISFEKSSQEVLNIVDFDKKDWSPKV